jgi:hypothetical protein
MLLNSPGEAFRERWSIDFKHESLPHTHSRQRKQLLRQI